MSVYPPDAPGYLHKPIPLHTDRLPDQVQSNDLQPSERPDYVRLLKLCYPDQPIHLGRITTNEYPESGGR